MYGVTMGGAWVDADGILNPRPPPVNKPPVPPKNRVKVGKSYNDPVRMHSRFAALEDMEASKSALPRSRSGSPLEKKFAGSFVQWNIRGLNANFEELCLLTKKYKPAVISLQETLLNNDKTRSPIAFNILTKCSPNGTATGEVSLFISKGNLFSPVQLDTPFQGVVARITLNKTVTFCRIYLPLSQNVSQTDF